MTGKLNIVKFLKRFPWWFYVAVLVAALFVWQGVSGWSQSRRLWNMVKGEIVADQVRIIEELEHQNSIDQKEKDDLCKEIARLKSQRVILQGEKDTLSKRIKELENALPNMPVPADPDDLTRLLHSLGLESARKSKR